MYRSAVAMLFCLLLLLPTSSSAQTQAPPDTLAQDQTATSVQRDPLAVQFVQASIAAMGGETAIAQIQDSVMYAEVRALQKRWPSGAVTWKTSGSSVRYEFNAGDASTTVVFGAKDAVVISGNQYKRLAAHERDVLFIPHLLGPQLLRRLKDPDFSFAFLGTENVNGAAAARIRVRWEANDIETEISRQDWLIDVATGLPVRVEYWLVDDRNLANTIAGATDFSDFRFVSGVTVPFRMVSYFDGQPWQETLVSSTVFNGGVSPSEFDVPGGVK
ncbi:MAG: hypothetical protein ACRD3A_11965 [Terriglobales bacterium]